MNSPYLDEQEELVRRLLQCTPYSRDWLEKQPKMVLMAIFHKHHQPQPNKTKLTAKRKTIDGINYILTDAGEWEEEQD